MTQASDDTSPADTEATASFGYREVPRAAKATSAHEKTGHDEVEAGS